MTEFDLLKLIGEADDQYIMEARRRPGRRFPWARAVAAMLAVALVGGAGVMAVRQGWIGGGAMSQTGAAAEEYDMEEAALPAEETVDEAEGTVDEAEEAEAAAEEAPAAIESGSPPDSTADYHGPEASAETYGAVPLALAEYPASIGIEDFEAASENWKSNQTTDETKAALNTFAYNTAAAILKDNGTSGAYSPLSLYQTLSILASGAEGETREQLLRLLGQPDLETLADQSGKLYRVNYKDNELVSLRIANSLWLDGTDSAGNPVAYRQDWVMSAARNYYADVYEAEFAHEDTALALGAWIAQKTGGLLHPSPETLGLDAETVMAIVNTLYYKTQWANEIRSDRTEPGIFTDESGRTVETDFMHTADRPGSYIRTDTYTKSYLPLYEGRMIFVLPAEGVGVDELLTEETLWEIFENGDYDSAEVRWSIPKFQNDATYELKDALEGLGVTDAFDNLSADFSPMASAEAPLYLGKVQQGTHIGVNEEGVEAAAYSMAGMMAGEGLPEEEPTMIEMDLSRPFLYLITANDGSTLFIGVVRDPQG